MDIVLRNNIGRTTSKISKFMPFSRLALFLLTLLLWIDRILLTYIRVVIMALPIIGFAADYLITAVYIILIVCSVLQIVKCMRITDLLFLIATAIICILNYLVFPDNAEMLDEYLPNFMFFTFPLYFIGLSLDFEKVYPWLYKLSLITIAAFTVYKLFIGAPMTNVQSAYHGDMWGAYNILPHVCVVCIAMLKKPAITNIVVTVMGFLMIAFLGSRGPLLCLVMAVAAYLIFFKQYKRPVLICSLIVIAAVIIVIGISTMVQRLYEISKTVGLSIRIFDMFMDGSISDDSRRRFIAASLLKRIAERPTFGYGMFADRVAIGTYAHNLAIELWHSFGVVMGTAVLGWTLAVLYRASCTVKKYDRYVLLFIPLLFAGFAKLFLSGSFTEEIYFFWLLGISVRLIRRAGKCY